MGISSHILIARRERERARHTEATKAPAKAPAAPVAIKAGSDGFPEGYKAKSTGGGYYVVTDPDGNKVVGPSNGKWQGKDGAQEGARNHAAMRLLER